jgi:hypothetical protein
MRRIIVTKKNKNSFIMTDTVSSDVLKTIDRLLHDRDLELVIGDEGGNSDYMIKIDKCREDEEYDADRAHTVLYGRGKGIFDMFEI